MTSADSPYSHFVRLRQSGVCDPWQFGIYTHPEFQGGKATLWPNVYFHHDLCESILDEKKSRASGKVSFTSKVGSGVVDYGLQYDLLSEGATIDKLLVRMDCAHVPEGLGYLALSRVRVHPDITFLTTVKPTQFMPVQN